MTETTTTPAPVDVTAVLAKIEEGQRAANAALQVSSQASFQASFQASLQAQSDTIAQLRQEAAECEGVNPSLRNRPLHLHQQPHTLLCQQGTSTRPCRIVRLLRSDHPLRMARQYHTAHRLHHTHPRSMVIVHLGIGVMCMIQVSITGMPTHRMGSTLKL